MRMLLVFCLVFIVLSSSFSNSRKDKLKLPEEFTRIPGGTSYTVDIPDSSVRISLNEFYISKFEITNKQYREFYNDISRSLNSGERIDIMCDSTGWNKVGGNNNPFINYYYRHPAYDKYPVVNISFEGAISYCKWLEKKLNENNPSFNVRVSLPSKQQWQYAAMGGRSQAMYPWGNFRLKNNKGEFLCNFKRVGEEAIYRNRQTGKAEVAPVTEFDYPTLSETRLYTSSVKSYYPNNFGLYNMCGNVAEMISEKGIAMGGSWNDYGGDVHINASAYYEKSAPTVGFRPIIIVSSK